MKSPSILGLDKLKIIIVALMVEDKKENLASFGNNFLFLAVGYCLECSQPLLY
jgi:hypothetical protein